MFRLRAADGSYAKGRNGVFTYTSRSTAVIAARILGKKHRRFYEVVKA